MSATYLYAVVAGDHEFKLDGVGLPDGASPVRSLPAGGFSAIVGEYDQTAFEAVSKEQLFQQLIVHQQVLEQVFEHHSLLPVKFGTVLASPDVVRQALTRYRARLEAAFKDVSDAVEVDLSASWDLNTMLAEVGRMPAVASLTAGAEQPLTSDPEQAARVGRLVYETLAKLKDEYRRRMVNALVAVASDAQPQPAPSDEVVLNVAFLVERDQLAEFDSTVERMAAEFEDRLSVRYVGPLPPYSFSMVEVVRPDAASIQAARALLELGDQVTQQELRAAYRRLAASNHPDRNPGDPSAQERFASLAAAHDLLSEYLRMQRADDEDADEGRQYDLTVDGVESTVLLEIRREEAGFGQYSEFGHEYRP